MRKKKTRRQKNEELKRRYEAVKNLMSTFAMSTVAVVAVVTVIPASAEAEITRSVALSDEIVYQVEVTDEESSLDLDSLSVVLENQLEYYEHPIDLGETSGYFENLKSNTEYRLSIYGNKGFGAERLDTVVLITRPKTGATIRSVTPITDVHNTVYEVDVSTYDPDEKYSSITLYYGYLFEPDDVELTYSSIPITSDREIVQLFDIWSENDFHIYLEGTTSEGTIILDEMWVTPPFNLYASLYIAYYNNKEIVFHPYGDSTVNDLIFEMTLSKDGKIKQTYQYTPSTDHYAHDKWIINALEPSTTYLIECKALYTNPQTLRSEEQQIYSEEITTTADFTYTYEETVIDEYLEITITLNDPNNVFSFAYYEVIDKSGEFDNYIDGESVNFETFTNEKIVYLTILIPTVEEYEIQVGMKSYDDYNVNKIVATKTSE